MSTFHDRVTSAYYPERNKGKSGGLIATAVVVFIAILALFLALETWLVMVLAGAMHSHEVYSFIPALSFTEALLFAMAVSTVGGLWHGAAKYQSSK